MLASLLGAHGGVVCKRAKRLETCARERAAKRGVVTWHTALAISMNSAAQTYRTRCPGLR
jgi:hypothetical protein